MASTLRFDNWEDSNGTPILDGTNLVLPSSALPAGSVLQVVSTTKTDIFSTSSTSFVDVTGLSVSVTPSSTNSKILVLVSVKIGGVTPLVQLVRNSTVLANNTDIANPSFGMASTSYPAQPHDMSLIYLDSPNNTSATTYNVQMKGADTVYVNRRGNDSSYGGSSSITIMEIAG